MAIRSFLQSLGATHLFMLDGNGTLVTDDLGDSVDPTRINGGDYSFELQPVCEGVTQSLASTNIDNFTARRNGATLDSRNDINGANGAGNDSSNFDYNSNRRSVHLWFNQPVIDTPSCIYEAGGSTNNYAFISGIARTITFQAADDGQDFLIAQSKFLAEENRNYFLCSIWFHSSQTTSIQSIYPNITITPSQNGVILFVNGVFQGIAQSSGATQVFPVHAGIQAIGNSSDNLKTYNNQTLGLAVRRKFINGLGMYNNNALTELEQREIFERTVIPEITIAADTVQNQQAALDALIGNTYSGKNCQIRIVQATDATDYRLFVDNITFIEDDNLRDISIQYAGANTLTLENVNGSNTNEVSTPFEVDLDGTTILTGGGSINILNDNRLRYNTVQDLSNVIADKIILEEAGDYNFTNVQINELENVSGGVINIVSDLGIPIITNTGVGSATNIVDSFLSFTDNWELYFTINDRNSSTNVVASGSGVDIYQFTYTPGVTYYLWVAGTKQQVTPVNTGETFVDLTTASLLTLINDNLGYIDKVIYCDTRLNENGSGKNTAPFNNIDDAIAEFNNTNYSYIDLKSDLLSPPLISTSIDNVKIVGSSPTSGVVLNNISMNNTQLENLFIQGFQGVTTIPPTYKNCSIVSDLLNVSGKLVDSNVFSLSGSDINITFNGDTAIQGVDITNSGETIFNVTNNASIAVRNVTGSFQLSGVSGTSLVSIDSISADLTINNDCTGGDIRVNDTVNITDNSNGSTMIVSDVPSLDEIKVPLNIMNEGIKKSSLSIPYSGNI